VEAAGAEETTEGALMSFDPGHAKYLIRRKIILFFLKYFNMTMTLSDLPGEISRKIYADAVKLRNEDIYRKIQATIAEVLDFVPSDTCRFTEKPLFEGSQNYIHVTKFQVDKLMEYNGIITTTMTFFVDDEEFEITKNEYHDGEVDYSLYVVYKRAQYEDIVSDTFHNIFFKGTVY
jgi:hypothetical protein